MIPPNLQPTMNEALAAFATLRSLSFSADDIYIGINGGGIGQIGTQVTVVLRHDGKEAIIVIGTVSAQPKEVQAAWIEACGIWKGNTNAKRKAIVDASDVRRGAVTLIANLIEAGFDVTRRKLEEV